MPEDEGLVRGVNGVIGELEITAGIFSFKSHKDILSNLKISLDFLINHIAKLLEIHQTQSPRLETILGSLSFSLRTYVQNLPENLPDDPIEAKKIIDELNKRFLEKLTKFRGDLYTAREIKGINSSKLQDIITKL